MAAENTPKQEDANVIAKSIQALDLRLQGLSYAKIAAIMGLSQAYVHKLVRRRLKENLGDKPEQLRRIMTARLDKLFEHAYNALLNTPDAPGLVNKDAIEAILKIEKRRAELLGLDLTPPKAVNLNVDNSQTTVQFYLPSNGRDDLPQLPPPIPAEVIDVAARVIASPDYEEEDEEAD